MEEILIKCKDCGSSKITETSHSNSGQTIDGLCEKCQSSYSKVSPDEHLSGSEALFGFCGWLTTRRRSTVMGSSFDCGVVAELIKEFCEINKLPEPRGKWTEYLTHPSDEQL